jgi:hypothetical protein
MASRLKIGDSSGRAPNFGTPHAPDRLAQRPRRQRRRLAPMSSHDPNRAGRHSGLTRSEPRSTCRRSPTLPRPRHMVSAERDATRSRRLLPRGRRTAARCVIQSESRSRRARRRPVRASPESWPQRCRGRRRRRAGTRPIVVIRLGAHLEHVVAHRRDNTSAELFPLRQDLLEPRHRSSVLLLVRCREERLKCGACDHDPVRPVHRYRLPAVHSPPNPWLSRRPGARTIGTRSGRGRDSRRSHRARWEHGSRW